MVPEMSRFDSLTPLLSPKSVAIIGASSDPARIGGRPIAYMNKHNFSGKIMPVNPNYPEIQGLPAYASIANLPETPDVAVIAVAADRVRDTITALGQRGCRAAVVFSSGFSEVGDHGARLQADLLAEARRWNMRILGPNCIGAFNASIGYYSIFASCLETITPGPGRVGIASQSGAYGAHILGLAVDIGMGMPFFASTGNESDVSLGEIVGWMAESPDIDVIVTYMETVSNVDSLTDALAIAHKARKPVIMQKVGRSALGRKAAMSHTASLTGDDAIFDAVLADYAVIRVDSSDELLDIAYAANRRIYPVNNTLGSVSISGGVGIIISDAAEDIGLPMPPMPEAAQRRLRDAVSFCSPINPVDATAHVLNDISLVGTFTEALVKDGGYTSNLAFFSQSAASPTLGPKMFEEFNRVKQAYPDRLFAVSLIGGVNAGRHYDEAGFLVYEEPVRAVNALNAMGRLGQAFARPLRERPPVSPVALPDGNPSEAEAKVLLSGHGIAAVPEQVLTTAEAAVAYADSIGYPVVMKIASPDILHKSEIGGVLLNIGNDKAVRNGFATLKDRAVTHVPDARLDGILIAKQITDGVECFMGIQHDPQFGPVAVFGLGGIFVEVLKDVVFRRCPVSRQEAEEMIRSIKGAPLLQGARGRKPADIGALADMLASLSEFAWAAGKGLKSIDLNPVFAMPEGQGAYAADAVIEVESRHDQ